MQSGQKQRKLDLSERYVVDVICLMDDFAKYTYSWTIGYVRGRV